MNQLLFGNCLELMKNIPPGSIDAIITDLPYGTTNSSFDIIIPFEPLWNEYKRVIKPNGAIISFSQQPFTSTLIKSQEELFQYELIWDKVNSSSGMQAKLKPLRSHENIIVFGIGNLTYNPQMVEAKRRIDKPRKIPNPKSLKETSVVRAYDNNGLKYPKSIITISNANQHGKIHPQQKPVEIFEYLIKTYSNEGETILDSCAGSFSSSIAAIKTNRHYIGIEMNEGHFLSGKERVENFLKSINQN